MGLSTYDKFEQMRERNDKQGLIKGLRSKDMETSFYAAYWLREGGMEPDSDVDKARFLLALGEARLVDKLVELGNAAIEPLIACLTNKKASHKSRCAAAEALGEVGISKGVAPLITEMEQAEKVWRNKKLPEKDRDQAHRFWQIAGDALSNISDPDAVKLLVKAVKGKNDEIRKRAGEALTKIGGDAVEPLIRILRSGRTFAKTTSAYTLGSIKDKRAVESLIKALDDRDWGVRIAAITALRRIGDKKAVAPLTSLVNDRNADVRKLAQAALKKLR
jgi:HEAT repeat protein